MARRAWQWALAGVASGCTSGAVAIGDTEDATATVGAHDSVLPGASDETTDGGPVRPPPALRAVPDAVARGGRIYIVSDVLPRRLAADIDGRPLGDPEAILQADFPGALYQVPDDLPLGPATLFVRHRDEPDSVVTHTLVIEPRRFVDVAAEVGLALVHDPTGTPPECAESHTGLAVGDYDNDGDPDLFVGNVGTGGVLMRNGGPDTPGGLPRFSDVTQAAGLTNLDQVAMATFIDLDGDGDLDLFVGRRGENRVLQNRLVPDGTATFTDITHAVGLGVDSQRTMGVAFGDYDGDDDLDLYVVNHAFCFPEAGSDIRAEDHLYENVAGVFVERTELVTGPATDSVGFSAAWIDVDGDRDRDLFIVNDDVASIGDPNALWRNDGPDPAGGWRFTDISVSAGVAFQGVHAMGLALGDVDHDGAVDLAYSNIGPNALLLGDGEGAFVDASVAAGVQRARLPWGRESITWAVHLLDHDNDGDLDLYYTGGRIKGAALIPDALFDNVGDAVFTDVTWTSGMDDPGHGKASALVDLDGDGAWDIVTAAWGEPLSVYHNRAVPSGHHWLVVALVGRGGNRAALGATVQLSAGGTTQTCFHTNRPSLGAGGETTCHFGLGTTDRIDAVSITWPDGLTEIREPPAVDQRVQWVHPGA